MLIVVPNFLGINGLLQRLFDPQNLEIHNLKAMKIESINNCIKNCGLTLIEANYYPSTQIWLENLESRGVFLKIGVRVIGKFMTILGMIFGRRNKLLSNSIYWIARN